MDSRKMKQSRKEDATDAISAKMQEEEVTRAIEKQLATFLKNREEKKREEEERVRAIEEDAIAKKRSRLGKTKRERRDAKEESHRRKIAQGHDGEKKQR